MSMGFSRQILEWVAVSHSQGISPTQGSNLCLLCLLYCQVASLPLYHPGRLYFYWSMIVLQCWVSLWCTTEWYLYHGIYMKSIYPFSFGTSPHSYALGHHRAPKWAPCTTQQTPSSYLFTPLVTAALFTIARTQKQPTCPTTDERIK